MPRKKTTQKLVQYFFPAGAKEKIDIIVDGSTFYKNKPVWKQKFYYLCDYIATQNLNNEHDVNKDYVNVHQETMAGVLGIDNRQMATVLKDSVGKDLLKTDGIWKAAVISRRGNEVVYIEEGKSYGYQFSDWNELTEISIMDNRGMNKKIINNTWEKSGKDNSVLQEYQDVLSFIKIDESRVNETLSEILSNKQKKKKQKENYRDFISETELHFEERNNKKYEYIPFDGVIVPEQTSTNSKAACSYLDSLQGGVFVPCQSNELTTSRKRNKAAKGLYEEPVQTTITRCRKALYIINGGYMIPTRPEKHSRVYCEVTNLNRELRRSIRLDGKKIIGLDIANSQPLIASILIKKYWMDKPGGVPEDVTRYQCDCEAGMFYNYFMTDINLPDELRPQFKEDFFSKVFFSMVIEKNNVLKDLFIGKYPSCWEAICEIKGGLYSDDYNCFAKLLQSVESAIIFDDVNMGLIMAGVKAFNIFDSIYVNNRKDLELAKALMVAAFNKFGVHPTIKTEYEEHLSENEQLKVPEHAHSVVLDARIPTQTEIEVECMPAAGLTAEEQKYIQELDEICKKGEARSKEQELIRQSYLDRTVKGSRW